MGLGMRDLLFLGVVLGGAGIMGAGLLRTSGSTPAQASGTAAVKPDLGPIVSAVDASFRRRWSERGWPGHRRRTSWR